MNFLLYDKNMLHNPLFPIQVTLAANERLTPQPPATTTSSSHPHCPHYPHHHHQVYMVSMSSRVQKYKSIQLFIVIIYLHFYFFFLHQTQQLKTQRFVFSFLGIGDAAPAVP